MPEDKKLDELFKDEGSKQFPKIDELVKATVVSIDKGEIYLDIDGIFTGIVRGRELIDESGQFSNLSVGDEVKATVMEHENEKGLIELSFRSAGHQQAWENLAALQKSGEIVEVKVLGANKGGLMVQLDKIPGFLPVSQLSPDNYPRVEGGNKAKILEKLKSFINQKLKVKVIDTDEKEEKLIVSEKDVYAKEHKEILGLVSVGDQVDIKVTAVVDFGVFVEFYIDGDENKKMEGLVHISELAWQRIDHPKDIFKNGDRSKAEVISVDNGRVSLSIKKLQEDPWLKVAENYKIGHKVTGKVLKIDKFGAFVELTDDIHGLAHVSELSNEPVTSPEDIVKVGEDYEFTVVSIEPKEHRLGLSLKDETKAEEKSETQPPSSPSTEVTEDKLEENGTTEEK